MPNNSLDCLAENASGTVGRLTQFDKSQAWIFQTFFCAFLSWEFRPLRWATKGFAFGNHKRSWTCSRHKTSLTKTFYFLLLCSFAFKKVFSTSWARSALWRSGLFLTEKYFSTFLPKGPAGTPWQSGRLLLSLKCHGAYGLFSEVFHANILRPPDASGQGHTDSRVDCRSATLVALLIELKAQIL